METENGKDRDFRMGRLVPHTGGGRESPKQEEFYALGSSLTGGPKRELGNLGKLGKPGQRRKQKSALLSP